MFNLGMETETFIIIIDFHKNILQGQIMKEVAISSINNKKTYHWFVQSPSFLKKLYIAKRRKNYTTRRYKRMKDYLTYGETIAEIKRITLNCKIIYSYGIEAIAWLLNNIPCIVSGDLPPLVKIPQTNTYCSFHSTLRYNKPNCAYNTVMGLVKTLNKGNTNI